MSKYLISPDSETEAALLAEAERRSVAPELLITEILNTMLVKPHNMNEKDMKAGYEESAADNLEWANLSGRE